MEEIRSKIKKILENKKIEVKKLSLLAGDASNRKYFQYFKYFWFYRNYISSNKYFWRFFSNSKNASNVQKKER